MSNKDKITRRKFIKGIAATTASFTIVPRHVLGGVGYKAPSDQLTKAVIGVGGMGRGHLNYGGTKLLAVCDVDEKHLQKKSLLDRMLILSILLPLRIGMA